MTSADLRGPGLSEAGLIELHMASHRSGYPPVWFNARYIVRAERCERSTFAYTKLVLDMPGPNEFGVRETPEEIVVLARAAMD